MPHSIHILLVDDDYLANQESSKLIREHGLCSCVRVALNGGHALLCLDQVYSHLPHDRLIILLDTQMPIMNGFEFLNEFGRANYRFKNKVTIIMMLSGQNNKNDMEKARQYGISCFIQKPVDPVELARLVTSDPSNKKVA